MPFETFERREAARGGRGNPSVRVTQNGDLLTFNAAAARLIEGVTHVQLLYDREERIIGFRPTDADDPNSFSVGRPASAANVGARAFVRHFGIPVGQRFPLERDGHLFLAKIPEG